jgi:hypothetical protein
VNLAEVIPLHRASLAGRKKVSNILPSDRFRRFPGEHMPNQFHDLGTQSGERRTLI